MPFYFTRIAAREVPTYLVSKSSGHTVVTASSHSTAVMAFFDSLDPQDRSHARFEYDLDSGVLVEDEPPLG